MLYVRWIPQALTFVCSLRRGFKVFSRSCQGCHGAMHQKYDLLVEKGFTQQELVKKMVVLPKVHPGHQKHRSDYF